MNHYSSVLAVSGSLCLTITLLLSWCLVGVRSSAFMKKVFPSYQQLLKAHMDYLLMSGLLMIFYLLFANFRVSVSPVILVAMSVGSLMNPVGFLALAIKPDIRQHPTSAFGGLMAGSFTLTTIRLRRCRMDRRTRSSTCTVTERSRAGTPTPDDASKDEIGKSAE